MNFLGKQVSGRCWNTGDLKVIVVIYYFTDNFGSSAVFIRSPQKQPNLGCSSCFRHSATAHGEE